jgi:hypothetical protein
MRTLILTGPNDCAQQAVSRALKLAFASRGDTCLAVCALELLGAHPSLSQKRAVTQALESPRAFAFLSAGGAFVRTGKPKTPVYEVNARYAEHLRVLLQEGEFDAVLCLHRYPAEAVSHLRKQLAFSARCCFVSCDYACVPFLEETQLAHYFIADESFVPAYVSRGIAQAKLISSGIPLPADWFCAEERADARAFLNLPQHIACYVLPYAVDAEKAVLALLSQMRGESGRVCVVSPDSMLPKSPFVARFAGDIRVVVVDPEDSLARYLAACDLMLASPSGALSAAAACCNLPLVHLPPATPLEAQSAQFFASRNMSLFARSEEEAGMFATGLCADSTAREVMQRAQQSACRADAAARIVRFLHEGRM